MREAPGGHDERQGGRGGHQGGQGGRGEHQGGRGGPWDLMCGPKGDISRSNCSVLVPLKDIHPQLSHLVHLVTIGLIKGQ